MKKLALLGASGHGKVVADIAICGGWQDIVFYDDAWPQRQENGAWRVVGDTSLLLQHIKDFDGVLVSIGDCETRWHKHLELKAIGALLVTLIHPKACISSAARLGLGSVVMPGSVVNVDASMGEACIVNTGATIDHDCVLGDAVHVSPGAHLSGNVTVGDGSWIGLGALVKQGVVIGKGVIVGAGSVVLGPVADGKTVIGTPARELTKYQG
jgi:sugar O-acyltransferase (sialic acid O-acetyltransferase NeuD family)